MVYIRMMVYLVTHVSQKDFISYRMYVESAFYYVYISGRFFNTYTYT